jgi:small GTP-binding protein
MAAELRLAELNAQLEQEEKKRREKFADVERRRTDGRDPDYVFNVVLIGDSNVGKTSLRHRYVNNTFLDPAPSDTVIPDKLEKYVSLMYACEPFLARLDIWDTNGLEQSSKNMSELYTRMDGVMFVYDVTNKQSVINIRQLYADVQNVKKEMTHMVIGTKCDLVDEQLNTPEDQKRRKKDIEDTTHEFFESIDHLVTSTRQFCKTSAKNGENVEIAFEYIASLMLERKRYNMLQAAKPVEQQRKRQGGGKVNPTAPLRVNAGVEPEHIPYDHLFRVVVVGANHAGKSCLIKRYIFNEYNDWYISTLGFAFTVKNLRLKNNGNPLAVKLMIYDAKPENMFIPASYYKEADGYIIVFDPGNKNGARSIAEWADLTQTRGKTGVPRVLVAAKADVSVARADAAEIWSKYKAQDEPDIISVSAKTNTNVDEPFFQLAAMLLKKVEKPDVPDTRRSASADPVIPFSSALLRTQNAAAMMVATVDRTLNEPVLKEYITLFNQRIRSAANIPDDKNDFAIIDITLPEKSQKPRLFQYPYGATLQNIKNFTRFVCPLFGLGETPIMAEFTHVPENANWPYRLTIVFVKVGPDFDEDAYVKNIISQMLKSGDRLDGGAPNRETNPFKILAAENYQDQVDINVLQQHQHTITSVKDYIAIHKELWTRFFSIQNIDFNF